MTPQFALFESFVWWARLTPAQQLFYGIGIIAGTITLIMAVLGLIGFGHDAADGADVSVGDHDHLDGSSLFSTKPLTGFFLGFGWAGGIALESGMSLTAATIIAFVTGVVLMLLVAWMIRAIYSMRSDGTRQINDTLGAIATVYVSLPPRRASGGQVSVTVSGRLETMAALNDSGRPIPSGEKVKVIAIVDGSTLLVEPLP